MFEGAILQIWLDFWDFEGPFGRPFSVKILNFSPIRFLINFEVNFGRGRRKGADPPETQEPEEIEELHQWNWHALHTLRGGGGS